MCRMVKLTGRFFSQLPTIGFIPLHGIVSVQLETAPGKFPGDCPGSTGW